MDVFEYRMFKTNAKAKARNFEAKYKAKATTFCPRAVLEVEDSPRRPHPCRNHAFTGRV